MFAGSKFKNVVFTPFGPSGELRFSQGTDVPSGRALVRATARVLVTHGDAGVGALAVRPLWEWSKEEGVEIADRAAEKRSGKPVVIGKAGEHVDLNVRGGTASVSFFFIFLF
jgi:hypothetical protein